MRWSLRLGAYRGIDVYVHVTFFLLLGFWAYSGYTATGSFAAAWGSVLFILAVFGCVLLHEFGHALAAAHIGIPTRDIVLYPIGGVARLERMPREPGRELWVAIAGPAVNVLITLVIVAWLRLSGTLVPLAFVDAIQGPFLERLAMVNIGLVLFNMVPAFPMDGGRVMRALLALRLDHAKATTIAARTGQAIAVAFGLVGVFTGRTMLVLIAMFVWSAARQENRHAQMQKALDDIPLHHVMQADVPVLATDLPLMEVVRITVANKQRDFPVIAGGRLVGVLWREDLLRGLQTLGADATVADVTDRGAGQAHLGERVDTVLQRFAASGARLMPVTDAVGRLVGVVTPEATQRFWHLYTAGRG